MTRWGVWLDAAISLGGNFDGVFFVDEVSPAESIEVGKR